MSNTFKQFVDNSVYELFECVRPFCGLALKGLINYIKHDINWDRLGAIKSNTHCAWLLHMWYSNITLMTSTVFSDATVSKLTKDENKMKISEEAIDVLLEVM